MRIERLIKIQVQNTLNDILPLLRGRRFFGYKQFKKKCDTYFPFKAMKEGTGLRWDIWNYLVYKFYKILQQKRLIHPTLAAVFLGVLKKTIRRLLMRLFRRKRMKHEIALKMAEEVKKQLEPHCERIEIAGSIRRKKPDVGDIEIVAIPKPYGTGLFSSGIATVVEKWKKIKGELPCKYTQRELPGGMILDLFFATPENWGLILAIRTGSADFSHHILAKGWVCKGYKSVDGMLTKNGIPFPVREEEQLFALIGMDWVPPEQRELRG